MIRDLLKWVVPGLATVLGGTTICLAMTSSRIADDVSAQSRAVLDRAGVDWADLSVDMRDISLSGTTTDQARVDSVVNQLSSLAGVRSVATAVTLAPVLAPYRFEASIADGAIAVSGGVPDITTRDKLLAHAGVGQGDLVLSSGLKNRQAWLAGAEFAIDRLQYFDQGRIEVSDLTVNVTGRAKSVRDYRDLLIVMRAGAPQGTALGKVDIEPALVSPYEWTAVSDGQSIAISGFVPNDQLADRLRTAAAAGLTVSTGLALGSGAPEGFDSLSQTLIEQLSRLEYGSASITDGISTLTGAPPSEAVAQAVVEALEPAGSIITLEPPRIADYWVSVTRQASGTIVFDGYAPDEATRERLAQHKGADASFLKLGRGAPERYQSAVDFGLTMLDRMSEGRFALNGTTITLTGTANSGADYQALLAAVAEQAPQGLTLTAGDILPPRAAQYEFAAIKQPSGTIVLTGLVPNPQDLVTLTTAAGPGATASTSFASGAPTNFVDSAQTGLNLLQWLAEGKISFDGSGWLLTGTPKSAIDKAAAETDFATRQLAAAGWSMALAEPQPVIAVASPYIWSATRSAAGVSLAGSAPTPAIRQALVRQAGPGASDGLTIATGEPEGFDTAARAALAAVLALDSGTASYDGNAWSLSGNAASAEARDAVLAALSKATDTAAWTVAITAPEALPASPYVWSATKAADGVVTMTGLVPADTLKRFISVRAGAGAVDETVIDPNAPAGFADDVVAGLDALAPLTEGRVSFDGSKWSIEGTLPADADDAAVTALLSGGRTPAQDWQVTLVHAAAEAVPAEPAVTEPPAATAEAAEAEPAAAEAPFEQTLPVVDPAYAFSASRSADGSVILSGQVPDDAALQQLTTLSKGDAAAVSLAEGAPDGFLASAEIGLRALQRLTTGQLDFANGAWRLSGSAPDPVTNDAISAAVAADTAATWTLEVTVPPPAAEPEVAATEPVPETPPSPDLSACIGILADFSGRNAILFQSGAALISAESERALDELAMDLKACPPAQIHVEGHTDADGDPQQNLALSVARAEAVVSALIERGVDPSLLYAVGYGAARPVADNDTAAGKRLNRRIVVTVSNVAP